MKKLLVWCTAALAPTTVVLASTVVAQAGDPCRAEVSRFEQAIGFVRQSQGNQAAADLKERLLPAKLEAELLLREGYCGVVKYLREKKLSR